MSRGVPKGYTHHWKYVGRWKEKKTKPGTWTFSFHATKRRRANRMGTMNPGTVGAWDIKGTQYIQKTSKGSYQTEFYGTKRAKKFYVKRKKR